MAAIEIAYPGILYNGLIEIPEAEKAANYEEIMEASFAGSIVLPHERYIQFRINAESSTYQGSMSMFSKNASDFSGFHQRIRKNLKRRMGLETIEMNRKTICIQLKKEVCLRYGISVIEDPQISYMDIFFGRGGLIPRNVGRRRDFFNVIREIEEIASIAFHPFLLKKGLSPDLIYYLNPMFQHHQAE